MTDHPIDAFLDAWSAAGGRDGVDLRLRVYRALALGGPWDRTRLRATLRALLALDDAERARFDPLFDGFFPDLDLPAWLAARLTGEGWDRDRALAELRRATTEATPSAPPRPPPQPRLRWWQWFPFVAVAGLSALVAVLHDTPARRPVAPIGSTTAPPSGDVPSPPPDAAPAVPDALAPPAAVLTPPRRPEIQAVIPTPLDAASIRSRTLAAALLFAGALALGEFLTRWWRARPLALPGLPERPVYRAETLGEREPELRARAPVEPFSSREFDDLAWRTGFAIAPEHPRLDLAATIQSTAREGGLLVPVYRPGTRVSRLRVVLPSSLDPVAQALVGVLIDGLRRRGVPVERAYGAPSPEPADLTLVLVDATRPDDPPVNAWMQGAHTALIEVRDPGLWGVEVEDLPAGVFTLDADGLAAALDAAMTNRRPPPSRAPRRGSARDRLGEALPLAAACALASPVDLATADALRRAFAPELPLSAIQRVVRLPGVTGGSSGWTFPVALRDDLCARFAPEWRADVLRWQQERLCSIATKEGTRARYVLALEAALIEWQLGFRDEAAIQRWVRDVEPLLADDVLRRRFEERRRQWGTALPKVSVRDARLQGRLARVGVSDAPAPRSRSRADLAWVAITGALALGMAGVGGWKLAAEKRHEVVVWSGPESPLAGGMRGTPFTLACPRGEVVIGLKALVGLDDADRLLDPLDVHSVVALCGRFDAWASSTPPDISIHRLHVTPTTPTEGSRTRDLIGNITEQWLRCPQGSAVVGIRGDTRSTGGPSRSRVTQVQLACGYVQIAASRESGRRLEISPAGTAAPGDEQPRGRFDLACGPSGVVSGLRGRSGSILDALGVQCSTLDLSDTPRPQPDAPPPSRGVPPTSTTDSGNVAPPDAPRPGAAAP